MVQSQPVHCQFDSAFVRIGRRRRCCLGLAAAELELLAAAASAGIVAAYFLCHFNVYLN
jgi:hypothetical protein